MEEYKFIKFESENLDGDDSNEEPIIREELKNLISRCDFIVTSYSTMYNFNVVKDIVWGHRGPQMQYKTGGYDWYYNISGGYEKVIE